MIVGNAGGMSGAGVGFTRNSSNGDTAPWVDFLFNAQGEDVVSGRRSAPMATANWPQPRRKSGLNLSR
ncbi:hypothetical protein ACVDG8_007430 [Mesorhizobium sp. ORM8.1]